MPELPEVESLVRSLRKFIIGKKIIDVSVHKPKIISGSGTKRVESQDKLLEFIKSIKGQKIISIERRAKNIIIKLENDSLILVHLKMTGQLVYVENGKNKALGGHPIEISESTLPNKHSHIVFNLDKGTLFYNDIRMFGYVLYYEKMSNLLENNHFKYLGLEPWDTEFTLDFLYKSLNKSNSKLKTVLMNQKVVVGLGNIYVDEVCFRCKIRPDRISSSLTLSEVELLYENIIKVFDRAIELGGSSVANYIMADGSRGTFAREHKVYGRGGKECLVCGNILNKSTINNRTTVMCLSCQK